MSTAAARSSRGRNAEDWALMDDEDLDPIVTKEDELYLRNAIRSSKQLRDGVREAGGMGPFRQPMTIKPLALRLVALDDFEKGTWLGVVQAIAQFIDVPVAHLVAPSKGSSRKPIYVRARALVAIILLKRGFSYPRIGEWLGGRDHSTIINCVDRYADKLTSDELALIEKLSPPPPPPEIEEGEETDETD